jgi:hypothetical protein
MDPHFWDVIRDIRSLIQRPDGVVYILHTPLGAITVNSFVYRAEAGGVFIQGIDENGRDRIVGFSERQASTFPFEIRTPPASKSGPLRFNPNIAVNLY